MRQNLLESSSSWLGSPQTTQPHVCSKNINSIKQILEYTVCEVGLLQSPQSAEDPNDYYFSLLWIIIIVCVWTFCHHVYCAPPMYNTQGVQKVSVPLELELQELQAFVRFPGVLGVKPKSPKTTARETAEPPLQSLHGTVLNSQASLRQVKGLMPLPPPPECWDYRLTPPHLDLSGLRTKHRLSWTLGEHSTNWASSPVLGFFCFWKLAVMCKQACFWYRLQSWRNVTAMLRTAICLTMR